MVSTVPTLVALWPAEALDRVRLLIVGGESCPPELVERLAVPGREFWNTYGPTEATVVACASLMRAGSPVRIGTPLDGWELAVVDAQGAPVPWGQTGELLISGVGTARYLDPAKDAEKFAPHPALGSPRVYRTGDLVRAEREGLIFVGRADEQVKIGGRRIELGEVDAALQALPGVRAAAAAVKDSPAGGQVLVGYLVVDGPAPQPGTIPHQRSAADSHAPSAFDKNAARELLLQRLPPALVPVLALVDDLPTRTSGKVDRKALPWPLPGHPTNQDSASAAGSAAGLGGTAGWIAEQWQRLLGVPVEADSDFFGLGGSSLTAARLVGEMRDRFPGFTVKDLYQHPKLPELTRFLDASERAGGQAGKPRVRHRRVHLTPATAGLYQAVVLAILFVVTAVPWVLGIAAMDDVIGPVKWAPHASWWLIVGSWLALGSAPARMVISGVGARVFTHNLQPGSYHRGGWTHLRLWTAERLVGAFSVAGVAGTPMASRYARILGCRIGRDVQLHSLPPVTGMAAYGDGAVLEPEVDCAGWWIEGDLLHVGGIRIGPHASVGTRSMLMPGADIGAGAEVMAGSCVSGTVPEGERWHGTPARRDENAPTFKWPPPQYRQSRSWTLAYMVTLPMMQLLPLLAAAPALVALYLWRGAHPEPGALANLILLSSVPFTLVTVVCYMLLTAVVVRVLSRRIVPGVYAAHGRVAWNVWVVHRLMETSRVALFPLYASLATPVWLRMLGARIGRRVEASTVLALPSLMEVDDHAFLADDTLIAPFEIRGGWLRLGPAHVGKRAFVGNSGIVGPFRRVADESLIGVHSDTPPRTSPGDSWLGRPAFTVQRQVEGGENSARTYDPPFRLVAARACVELCRWLPLFLTVLLADLAVIGVQAAYDKLGRLRRPAGRDGAAAGHRRGRVPADDAGQVGAGRPVPGRAEAAVEFVRLAQRTVRHVHRGAGDALARGVPDRDAVHEHVDAQPRGADREGRVVREPLAARDRPGDVGRRRDGQPRRGVADAPVPGPADADGHGAAGTRRDPRAARHRAAGHAARRRGGRRAVLTGDARRPAACRHPVAREPRGALGFRGLAGGSADRLRGRRRLARQHAVGAQDRRLDGVRLGLPLVDGDHPGRLDLQAGQPALDHFGLAVDERYARGALVVVQHLLLFAGVGQIRGGVRQGHVAARG